VNHLSSLKISKGNPAKFVTVQTQIPGTHTDLRQRKKSHDVREMTRRGAKNDGPSTSSEKMARIKPPAVRKGRATTSHQPRHCIAQYFATGADFYFFRSAFLPGGKTQKTNRNEVQRYDKIQQSGHNKNQYPCDERSQRR
jgi:hypothetical protein